MSDTLSDLNGEISFGGTTFVFKFWHNLLQVASVRAVAAFLSQKDNDGYRKGGPGELKINPVNPGDIAYALGVVGSCGRELSPEEAVHLLHLFYRWRVGLASTEMLHGYMLPMVAERVLSAGLLKPSSASRKVSLRLGLKPLGAFTQAVIPSDEQILSFPTDITEVMTYLTGVKAVLEAAQAMGRGRSEAAGSFVRNSAMASVAIDLLRELALAREAQSATAR